MISGFSRFIFLYKIFRSMALTGTPSLQMRLENISTSSRDIIEELLGYLRHDEFDPDPRTCLFPETTTSTSQVINISDHNSQISSYISSSFYQTIQTIECAFYGKRVRAHFSLFTPGMDFLVAKGSDDPMVYRCALGLIIGHPMKNTGVWIEGRGVKHHETGKWIIWRSNIPHNFFNYSKSDRVILVIDVNMRERL